MSDWSEQSELRELSREPGPAAGFHRGWYAAAFALGAALICALGLSTDLFDSGPTAAQQSAAYRTGFDRETADAEAHWDDALTAAWQEGYRRGQDSGSSMAPVLIEAVRDGFSWESGFEAGLQSADVDLDQRYREGWMLGFRQGWAQVDGTPIPGSHLSTGRQSSQRGADP